ncbi:MAG: CPBP family intramembrane metalloprotease [Luteolibacter sp.]
MKRFLQSEAGAAVMWVLGALLLAAAISPWLYQAGKSLAANAEANRLPAILEWLGAACGRSKFGRFFSRALMVSALALLPALLHRVKTIRRRDGIQIPPAPSISWKNAILQLVTALLIAAGLLLLLGWALDAMGAYLPNKKAPSFGKLLASTVPASLAVAFLEEWLFRGLMLGLWLRFARPLAACIGCSLVFAFVHFLSPPDGVVIAHPAHPLAGFQLLGGILGHFSDPVFFVTDFLTLFVIGMILAGARLKTGKLWFSIGLHAGWVMAYQSFERLHRSVDTHPLRPWGVGDTLRSGALPLATLCLTALVCHWVIGRLQHLNRASR